MDIQAAKQRFDTRAAELKAMCQTASPWVFVCASAFLDYLARLVAGQNRGKQGYIDFIRCWMHRVRTEYRDFQYTSGQQDLPEQMYHVLRCGIVHSLSLIPDSQAKAHGGRDRSIVLGNRNEAQKRGLVHLGNYSSTAIQDAALFVAEDLADDLASVLDLIFAQAANDQGLKSRMESWLEQHPLISGGF